MNIEIEQPKPRDPRALNAYRHGLTGQVRIQTPEEGAAYTKHCKEIHTSLAPVGGMEIKLVQTIADDQWRLDRAKSIEEAIFAAGIEHSGMPTDIHPELFAACAMAHTWLKDDKKIALLNLYGQRIQNAIHRNINLLRQMQKDRQAALEKAAAESNLLAQLAESKGESYDPHRDLPREALPAEFVFSPSQIANIATHQRRLAEVKSILQTRQTPLRKAA
jgi:hypothetical protein